MGTRCEFYKGKSGSNNYGFKCGLYHNGNFKVWSDGERIIYPVADFRNPCQYHKEARDKYVSEKCMKDCNSCSLFKGYANEK